MTDDIASSFEPFDYGGYTLTSQSLTSSRSLFRVAIEDAAGETLQNIDSPTLDRAIVLAKKRIDLAKELFRTQLLKEVAVAVNWWADQIICKPPLDAGLETNPLMESWISTISASNASLPPERISLFKHQLEHETHRDIALSVALTQSTYGSVSLKDWGWTLQTDYSPMGTIERVAWIAAIPSSYFGVKISTLIQPGQVLASTGYSATPISLPLN